jgi:hypothetical protein
LSGKRLPELERHALPDGPAIILNPLKGTIQTGRGDFQRVGMRKGISHVERRTKRFVCALTIVQRNAFRFIDEDPHDRTRPLPHTDDIRQFQA